MTNVVAREAPVGGVGAPVAARKAGPADEFFRGVTVVAYREILRLVHDKSRIVSSLAMPLMFFVMFGAGFGRAIGGMAPGVNFIQFLFPGIIAQTVFMTSIFSGMSVVWDREFGFLRELLVAPISRAGIVIGKVIGGAILALFQAAIVLVLAPFLKVKLDLQILATAIPLLVLFSFSLSSLGILMASRMRSQQGFQMMMQLLIMPMIFLSGAFFPLNNVPAWLSIVSKLNPLTYGVDAIRHAFLDHAGMAAGPTPFSVILFGHPMTMMQDVAIVAVMGAVLLAAATWSFSRQE